MFHTRCLKFTKSEIKLYCGSDYKCWKCLMTNLSDSMFDSSLLEDRIDDLAASGTSSNTGFSMLSFNARRLKNPKKCPVISSWLHTMDPTIVCINETWLN
jgi:hypothetical protein